MAQNHSVLNPDEQKKSPVRGSGKEVELRSSPKNFTPLPFTNEAPVPLTVVQESVPLTIKHPQVSQAGVIAHPESIDQEQLEGTPAIAAPATSHFKEEQPLPEHELEKRSKPLKLFWEYLFTGKKNTSQSKTWEDVVNVLGYAKSKHREKNPEENGPA